MSTLENAQRDRIPSLAERPPLDPHPLSPYVAWAGHRNRGPILEIFKQKFPTTEASVLEVASGSGMHLHYFAPDFPQLTFQPSDLNEEVFATIQQRTQETQLQNVRSPLKIDLTQAQTWSALGEQKFAAIFLINVFQVAPVEIADGLTQLAATYLTEQGALYIYGPFKVNGEFTTSSNQEFDQGLRSYGVPEWGLKDVAEITRAATQNGLRLKEIVDMPANNFILIYSASR